MEPSIRRVAADDGGELLFEVAGAEGSPVAFLHGSFAGRSTFRNLRTWLADDHRLLLTALRGHDGTAPTVPDDYGLATTGIDDLLAVLDAEGIERAHLVGHSTGGAIALACALRRPDRVDRLVLIEPTMLSLLLGADAERARVDLARVLTADAQEDDRAALRVLLDVVGGPAWAAMEESARQRVADNLAPLAGLAVPHVHALLGLQVEPAEVVSLAAPALLVYGTASIYFEAPIAARFAELRPDLAQLHVEGAGHNVHVERADDVGPAVAAFLRVDPAR